MKIGTGVNEPRGTAYWATPAKSSLMMRSCSNNRAAALAGAMPVKAGPSTVGASADALPVVVRLTAARVCVSLGQVRATNLSTDMLVNSASAVAAMRRCNVRRCSRSSAEWSGRSGIGVDRGLMPAAWHGFLPAAATRRPPLSTPN
jgi:hypothetical protein